MPDERLEITGDPILVPYRRGVSLREVAKGALARFLPGSLLTVIGATTLFGIGISSDLVAAVGGVWGLAAVLTAGFGLGLLELGRWLYPDAKLDSSRSFVAGLVSPLTVFIVAAMAEWGWTAAQFPLIVLLVGVIMAVGMFFAWLTPTPEELRGHEFEPVSSDDLQQLSGRAL